LETRARWLAAENKLDEALESATAAVAAAPQSATAHYALAVVRDRRRDVPEAIASYNEVLRLNPRAAAAQVQLSRLSLATGDREAAVRFAEGASRTAPGAGEVRLALARSLLARGDLARATPEIAALLKQFPDNASVQSLEGALQMARGNTGGARTAFERALAAAPGMTEPIGGLTALDIRAKQPAAAVARLEAALRESPQNPALLALAAQAYGASGDLAKTEQSLRRAVEIDPRFTPGYAMLAQLYLAQKRLDQARGEFEGMVKRDPQNVQARTMVGVLLEAENKPAEARKWYEETVAITDRAPIVANNLAFMYAESGTNLDQALQLAQTAKQLLPESPDVDDTLGWVYYKKDQAALAVRPLESSVEKNPKNVMYLYHLGLAYAKAGNPVKARDMLQRALELDPTFAGADEARRTLDSLRG
jgi:tetratricopeptide (TPR) repeat protein